MKEIDVSVVIRTYNEERYLDELLTAIRMQELGSLRLEVVIVDSGSDDRTLEIAERHAVRVVRIRKQDFTFGRSLNRGCEAARGKVLVFASGHCIPAAKSWLSELVSPVLDGRVGYSYGRQLGRDTTKYSEYQVFEKYFPARSCIPQEGFFCNNANAALQRELWKSYRFDESLTGLEDLELAQRLVSDGVRVGYVAEASVYHIHDESWRQVSTRYEREALAMHRILPEMTVGLGSALRYFLAGVLGDLASCPDFVGGLINLRQILAFRGMQFWGVFRGYRSHLQLSKAQREEYFFPARRSGAAGYAKSDRPVAVKGAQRACS